MYDMEALTPSPEWEAWIRATFIAEGAPLYNHEHQHLQHATLGVILTNAECRSKGATVLGRAHVGEPAGSDAWQKHMKADLLTRQFGSIPDFYLILSAPFIQDRLGENDSPAVCALIEHELYHCAPMLRDGAPLFQKDGSPKWRIRPHDVEEFIGVVRRYGAHSPELQALTEAAERGPTIERAKVDGICGTCGGRL